MLRRYVRLRCSCDHDRCVDAFKLQPARRTSCNADRVFDHDGARAPSAHAGMCGHLCMRVAAFVPQRCASSVHSIIGSCKGKHSSSNCCEMRTLKSSREKHQNAPMGRSRRTQLKLDPRRAVHNSTLLVEDEMRAPVTLRNAFDANSLRTVEEQLSESSDECDKQRCAPVGLE